MADEAEPHEIPAIARRERMRCVEDRRRRARIVAPAASAGSQMATREDGRSEDHPQRVERGGRDFLEGALEEAVVHAPDDDHQDQQSVHRRQRPRAWE